MLHKIYYKPRVNLLGGGALMSFFSHHLSCNSVPFPIIQPSGNFPPLRLCSRARRAVLAPSFSSGQAIQSLELHFLGLWGAN